MRQKIVAGNWKMNKNLDEAKGLIEGIKKEVQAGLEDGTRVIIAPSFVNLESAVKNTENSVVEVAAQNMHQSKSGAYTGEISADMLTNLGVNIVILGHSERREYFGETDELLAQKVDAALENKLEVVFCFGELLEDRKSGNHFKVVENQLKKALFHLQEADFKNIILAYEPVWAIGTGETASPEQAQEIHAFVRELLTKKYGVETANAISILYGGSVKPANAKEIFSKPDVDGGLIGGAALKAEDFAAIIKSI
ncbi:MAG: triose-phosphate isomerase [Tenacibaculum sp.]|uniref:triose-phosphate isomerase n=1 Tax=Tenacibaculum sp. TaxID=1906242 RepID=UPI0017B0CCEC|nr:triose-phosphate isomerase [Tenacibaculum sp.]NVK08040.1 triose-phosphate isomerase [Tenacibaculum sp.]